jgi:hypothetical protein
MSKIFAQNIDLNKNEAINFRLENQITFPSVTAPDAGFVFFHSANEKFYGWDGTAWTELGLGGGGVGVADNLGNHIATQKLDMNDYPIDMDVKGSVFLGRLAGNSDNATIKNNIGIGLQALSANIAGQNNTAIGYAAMSLNPGGSQNVAIGNFALFRANLSSSNVAIGLQALANISNGSSNIAIGVDALRQTTTGGNNIAIGTNAGDNDSGDIKTNNFGILIGSQSDFLGLTSSKEMVIGYNVTGRGSNTMTIGDSGLSSYSFGQSIVDLSNLTTSRAISYPDRAGAVAIENIGTWTPTWIDTGGGATYALGGTHSYIRIGRMVFLQTEWENVVRTGTATGTLLLDQTSLPFPIGNISGELPFIGTFQQINNLGTTFYDITINYGIFGAPGSGFYILYKNSLTDDLSTSLATINTGTTAKISITYFTTEV